MSDVASTTSAPQPNSPEARDSTGALLNQAPAATETPDQNTPTPETTQPSNSSSETKPSTETKPEAPLDPKTGKPVVTSLLNEKGEAVSPHGAPEAYADFTAPEGVELDKETVGEAQTLFKELDLSQPAAQKLVDFFNAKIAKVAEAPFEAYRTMRKEWQDSVKADSEIGGGKFDQVKATIGRTLDSVFQGDPAGRQAFREAMDLTGAGDNPAFVRAFYRLAQKAGEGTSVRGGGPAPTGQSDGTRRTGASAMYPNLPSSQS